MVKYWRENGVNIVLYLDDGLGMDEGYKNCKDTSEFVKSSLKLAGFIVNEEKSIFEPVQCLEWLGLIWDSKDFTLKVPERRIKDTKNSLDIILKSFSNLNARMLAQFAGRIISMSPVMGNVTNLMTRHIYFAIENRKTWDSKLYLVYEKCVLAELKFWQENLLELNEKRLLNDSLPRIMIYSDASNVALGAYTVESNEKIFHCMLNENEKKLSSTWRELRAIQLSLNSFEHDLKCKIVKWHTDNQNCVNIINKGSTKLHLQHLAYDIFRTCTRSGITLCPTWIPRCENFKADFISKMVDIDDWQTSFQFFTFMNEIWGPYTIDRFANFHNTKLKRFNSKFWNPGSTAIDAFAQNWTMENNWMVPPISLVAKSIKHLILCRAEGTLIVPKWPSSAFWSLIFNRRLEFQPYVIEVLDFSSGQNIFVQGQNKNSIFGTKHFKSDILAIKMKAT
ncbi:uncharacterized protein [Mytilus edulis]|uniref:uncharacterized protein n=1 Tax=Mytilus edulis TaxID=6550 RepID=UPI0039F0EE24